MSTSLLDSSGAANCYHASMVSLIWFADVRELSSLLRADCLAYSLLEEFLQAMTWHSLNAHFLFSRKAMAFTCTKFWHFVGGTECWSRAKFWANLTVKFWEGVRKKFFF